MRYPTLNTLFARNSRTGVGVMAYRGYTPTRRARPAVASAEARSCASMRHTRHGGVS